MENAKRCQSCGMPMSDRDIVYGKNANGTTNAYYCSYCYNHGKFTSDMTMDQMIEHCAPHLASQEGITRDEARQLMRAFSRRSNAGATTEDHAVCAVGPLPSSLPGGGP